MTGLVKWDPWRELTDLRQNFDRTISDVLSEFPFGFSGGRRLAEGGTWYPAVDIRETKDNYEVHAELPGLSKDEISIDVSKEGFTVQGERKREVKEEDKDSGFIREERVYGKFQRSFAFETEINPEKVDAVFQDGILKMMLPKAEQAKVKSVKVKVK